MSRAPAPSEPNSTFPTYQVPQVSAMRGRAPPVQVARVVRGGGAVPSGSPASVSPRDASSVIAGSSCDLPGNSNLKMQSVTDNCLLNSVTVPNKQRNGRASITVPHNNSSKLDRKFGALLLGQDIPDNQKSDDLELKYASIDNKTTENEYCSLERLIKLNQRTRELERMGFVLPQLRLCGGGESSLSTGTSGWGTPPSQQASNNNASSTSGWGNSNAANQNTGTQQWNNNTNRPPQSTQGPSQQDGASNKTPANMSTNGQQPPTTTQSNGGWGKLAAGAPPASAPTQPSNNAVPPIAANGPSANTTKQQLEQLTTMREAIFSQDGWGGQHVNQDTNWDIPGSPEPPIKMDGTVPPPWKPTVNNGTELWEANLRNGGQPPPQPQQKTPWGHTPATNIGGTWGEDDDVADSSNVWTGVPSGQQQWGGNAAGNGVMWGGGGPKKENDWGGNAGGGGGGGWGDPRSPDPRAAAIDPREIRPDPRDIRAGSAETIRIMDPREQIRMVGGGDMRGDPRGITGRLNGAGSEAYWGQAAGGGGPHVVGPHVHHQSKIPGGGVGGNGGSGWEEPSPPAQRRNANVQNYDDGTSLWGNPQQGPRMAGGSQWKDLPTGASMGRGAGAAGLPGATPPRIKPDGLVWGHRTGPWDEPGGNWDETVPWSKQKGMTSPVWDSEMEWGHKQGSKQQLTKEMVWNSKQFRMLIDMGYKKDEVENALRMRDMNYDEALDMLSPRRAAANMDGWRGHHDDHQQFPGRFPSGPSSQMSFPPSNPSNLLNNMNSVTSGGGNNSLINSMSPAIVQKMLAQGGVSQGFGAAAVAGGRALQPQSQPSTQQLRMLVQQIQMAVQAGYLNHQILNQPLAPQTLVLLNQLLQQIKTLQQLMNQQNLAQQQLINGKPNNTTLLQCSVLITKTKQQIANLQNQIAAQQAIYVKQQQHQGGMGGGGGGGGGPADIFKSNPMQDSINTLQSNFGDLGIKDPQMPFQSQQQSRLNQWKLPAPDKEEGGEFSRAPGSISKPIASLPNMNPLGLTQSDGPWSSGRSADTGWPDSGAGDSNPDVKDSQWPTPAQPSLTDLVPEFEPGKPWKGNQLKSIEDDPSITPGSVVRSPLSIPTLKDNELFNINPSKSPPAGEVIQPLSLSSSTWSFNPPSSTSSAFTSPQSKLSTSKAPGETTITSELWGAPRSRGPPPGLSANGTSMVNGLTGTQWPAKRTSGNWGGSSPWLLLRNLTAQIDGSTLGTLCMQHGPLKSFHLFLHQGFALVKYSSREEATKAQTTLNNCILGNTTILAESPNEWEANTILQQMSNQQGASSGAWRGSSKQPGTDNTWSTGWPNNTGAASLWGPTALDSAEQARATPSNMNSFLPGDLLGGESM